MLGPSTALGVKESAYLHCVMLQEAGREDGANLELGATWNYLPRVTLGHALKAAWPLGNPTMVVGEGSYEQPGI